jgi:hypothetical protein
MRTAITVFVVTCGILAPRFVVAQDARGRREVASATISVVGTGTGDMRQSDTTLQVVNPTLDSRYAADIRGQLTYRPMAGDVSLSINADSAIRRYETGSGVMVLGHSIGGALGFGLGRRTRLMTSVGFSYIPSYSLVPNALVTGAGAAAGPGDVGAADIAAAAQFGMLPAGSVDATIAERVSYSTRVDVTASHELSKRISVNASVLGSLQEFGNAEDPSVLSRSVAAGVRYRLNRIATLRLSYSRVYGVYDVVRGVGNSVKDDIDAGVDYSYGRDGQTSLALTRSTSLRFTSGLSLSGTENAPRGLGIEGVGSSEGAPRVSSRGLTFIGSATLLQQLGRSGQLSLAYNRNVGFQGGFTEPVLGNAIVFGGRYQLGRRVQLSANGSGTANTVGLEGGAEDQYYTFGGGAQVVYAFHRQGQVHGQYSVASHFVGSGVEVLATVPRQQLRGSFQFGVTWKVPLLTARAERN